MSYLNLIPIRKLTEQAVNAMQKVLEVAVNNINEQNFPNRVNGDSVISSLSLSMNRLRQKEFNVPLLLPVSAAFTQDINGVQVGGIWRYISDNYYGGSWYLAGTLATENATATATLELWDSTKSLGSISTASTTGVWIKSNILTISLGTSDLVLKLKTSNASYKAYLYNAYLIYQP